MKGYFGENVLREENVKVLLPSFQLVQKYVGFYCKCDRSQGFKHTVIILSSEYLFCGLY